MSTSTSAGIAFSERRVEVLHGIAPHSGGAADQGCRRPAERGAPRTRRSAAGAPPEWFSPNTQGGRARRTWPQEGGQLPRFRATNRKEIARKWSIDPAGPLENSCAGVR